MNTLYDEVTMMINIEYYTTFRESVKKKECDYLLSLSLETLMNEIYDPNEPISETGNKFSKERYCKSVKNILKKFKANNYSMERKYHQNNNMGRLYVVDGGIQQFQKKLRGFLVCENTFDYDMKNAQPSILYYICKTYYSIVPIKYLEEYCTKRDYVLNNNNINKLDVIICMNTSNKKFKSENMWLKSFHQEIINIQNVIYEDVKHIITTDNKQNMKGSILNKLLCIYENYLLYLVCNYCITEKYIEPTTAEFDGLHITNPTFTDDFNLVTEKFGIRWEIKEFNKTLKINNNLVSEEYSDYEEQKIIFEKQHFMTKRPLRYYEIYTKDNLSYIYEYKENDFSSLVYPFTFTKYVDGKEETKIFFNTWKGDEKRKCYDNIEFLPPPLVADKNVYNSFPGFNYYYFKDYKSEYPNASEEDIKKNTDYTFIQNHIKHLCGSEMTEETFDYIEHYIANILFNPANIPRTAIILKSVPGAGKNLFFEKFFKNVLYEDAIKSSCRADDFFGKFANTEKTFVGIFDEASGKETFNIDNFMKAYVSNDIKTLEKKNIDAVYVKNFTVYLIFTNGETPIKIDSKDRRYTAHECDNKKISYEYVKKLIKTLDNKYILKAYVDYLKTKNFSEYDWIDNRPLTSYYRQLQSSNISQYELFLTDLIYKERESTLEFRAHEFYDIYTKYMKNKGFKEGTNTAFGRNMKKFKGIEKTKKTEGAYYNIDVKKMIEGLSIEEDDKDEYKLLCGISTESKN